MCAGAAVDHGILEAVESRGATLSREKLLPNLTPSRPWLDQHLSVLLCRPVVRVVMPLCQTQWNRRPPSRSLAAVARHPL